MALLLGRRYLVVAQIVFAEDLGPINTLRRSAQPVRDTWEASLRFDLVYLSARARHPDRGDRGRHHRAGQRG